jgi:hypothetical protein
MSLIEPEVVLQHARVMLSRGVATGRIDALAERV